jgi:argininosuccinate lyase
MLKQNHKNYRGFREPGIRLMEPLHPEVVSHRSEKEKPRLYAIHLFDKAHTAMLTEEGLIPTEVGVSILRALREMEREGVEKVRLETGGGMHSGEKYLIQLLGEEVGGRIHLGRSSGDLGEVSTRIYTRDRLLEVLEAINDFRAVLIDIAKEHIDVVMPGYTHGQHAQPTTYGHQLLSWASVLERDAERFEAAFKRTNISPAGAAIMTGSDFPINRQRVATFLGFNGVEKNTIDAILSYDDLFEIAAILAILYMNLDRWSEDLMLWSSSELNFIDIPDRYCGTSSIMMQKKNVYLTQWVKGAAAEATGGLVTTLMADKAPTGLPILEHQYSRAAITRTFQNLLRDLRLLAEMMPEIKVNREGMLKSAGDHWAQAADVAGMLVREKGLPWRSAHQIVGILVRLSYERGLKPRQIRPELLDEASTIYMGEGLNLDEGKLLEALDPSLSVRRRTLYGGPAPVQVQERMPEYEQRLSEDRQDVMQMKKLVEDGLSELEISIDRIIGSA